jgi:biopolymer transport protein TolQ
MIVRPAAAQRRELSFYQVFDTGFARVLVYFIRAFPAAHHHEVPEDRLRTVGWLLLALQGQATSAPEPVLGHDIISLVARSGPIAKSVLTLLLLLSVVSWTIVLLKWLEVSRARRQTKSFLDIFRRSAKFSEVHAVCRTLERSPLVGLFQAGYAELNAQMRGPQGGSAESRPPSASARPTLKSLDAVDRALLRAAAVEVNRLEHRVPFLATTASIAPFIGLFGTVWGIMTSFQAIGAVGSTNLAVVAPGIAEALIATAVGLFAAIPAAYFYNHFIHEVKELTTEMDDFALEFLNICERNFT